MLQELSHMDRITQLQDEIQQVHSGVVMLMDSCLTCAAIPFRFPAPADYGEQYLVPDQASKLPANLAQYSCHEQAR
jgi:hypothetical protein